MIATTTLAAPASAFALSSTTAAAGDLDQAPAKLRVSPGRVKADSPVAISGTAAVANVGETLALQIAASATGPWRQIAQTHVGAGGRFRFRAALRSSGVLRAIAPPASATPPRADDPAPANPAVAGAVALDSADDAGSSITGAPAEGGTVVSQATPVAVAARFALHRQELDVMGSSPMQISGRLLPASAGRVVRLQGQTPGGWRTVARSRTGPAGGFTLGYLAAVSGQRLRVAFAGDRSNAAAADAAGRVMLFTQAVVSWYDDGGNTACGFHASLGVANRTLPCGTKVTFRNGDRTATAVVDDRGPYVGGRDFDLDQATAAALGFGGVGPVWVSTS